jgi:hypothetical protein
LVRLAKQFDLMVFRAELALLRVLANA